ncbi:unnamed protein product [Polarella glacialis]|uniref:Reverse transcriptase Ty1/copia-type domain-containing protein n=1 Tax=Polarella glacialis TaxID=89957 RepID=A0A813KDX8_POLGL|nr:unnamed protein product [Polarella glacialis]CAE8625229.1 unnamed protein product [Polarella glacialis]CAE8704553.1 unnamed protein product [Polarella glacialis]
MLAFNLVVFFGAQPGWCLLGADAQCAYLQSEGIERLLLLRIPAVRPPPDMMPNQSVVAAGSIYGARDAPRAWYKHLRAKLLARGFREIQLEKSLYVWGDFGHSFIILVAHVDDLLITLCADDQQAREGIDALAKELQPKMCRDSSFTFCGKFIEQLDDRIQVSQPKGLKNLEGVPLSREWLSDVGPPLADDELSQYRGTVGQLMWLITQTRPD